MTDTPTPPPTEPKKIDWPQTAIAIAVLALLGVFWTLLEPERAEPATAALVTVLGLLGLAATVRGSIAPEGIGAALGALIGIGRGRSSRRPPASSTSSADTTRRDHDRRSGHVVIEAMVVVLMAAGCWIAGMLVSGCSMSTLAAHSTAARATTVVLDEAWRVTDAALVDAVAACPDAACAEVTRSDFHLANTLLLALEAGVAGWVARIELGHLSGMDEALELAIREAAQRVLDLWSPLAASLAHRGVTLPPLPSMVLSWVGGES